MIHDKLTMKVSMLYKQYGSLPKIKKVLINKNTHTEFIGLLMTGKKVSIWWIVRCGIFATSRVFTFKLFFRSLLSGFTSSVFVYKYFCALGKHEMNWITVREKGVVRSCHINIRVCDIFCGPQVYLIMFASNFHSLI